MEFLSGGARGTTALLAGAWNPPTRAHVAMARAALERADCAVLVLPRRFPHKGLEGAAFELRAEWLRLLAQPDARLGAAISEGGLFIEMAREARAAGAERVAVVCGSDAAERITGWDYGDGAPIEAQLREYELLVAPRPAVFVPPAELAGRIHALELEPGWEDVSSTEVRRRMEAGEPWEALVPEEIRASVRGAYS
jgi:nicotinic acid mononucleotide adenylyltransferase